MQRKTERVLNSFSMGLLGLFGMLVALVAAYYIYTGVRQDIKKQRVVFEETKARSKLSEDTPLAIALVKARHPDVEAECARRIKFYSDSVFASIDREIRSWQVKVAGMRVYTVSHECAVIIKTLDTVDIKPLKIGMYILKTDYKVDLNLNKILKKDTDVTLKILGRSSWYQKMGG